MWLPDEITFFSTSNQLYFFALPPCATSISKGDCVTCFQILPRKSAPLLTDALIL